MFRLIQLGFSGLTSLDCSRLLKNRIPFPTKIFIRGNFPWEGLSTATSTWGFSPDYPLGKMKWPGKAKIGLRRAPEGKQTKGENGTSLPTIIPLFLPQLQTSPFRTTESGQTFQFFFTAFGINWNLIREFRMYFEFCSWKDGSAQLIFQGSVNLKRLVSFLQPNIIYINIRYIV